MRESLSTVDDALSQSLRTSEENPPLTLLYILYYIASITEHLWICSWAIDFWFWGPDTKSWCLKVDEGFQRNPRRMSKQHSWPRMPGAVQISLLQFSVRGNFQISTLFYSVTARSDGLPGPELNPEKNPGFSLCTINVWAKCSKAVECCIISSGE